MDLPQKNGKQQFASNIEGRNIRDYASIDQLVVLANIEFFNSELIQQGLNRDDRAVLLKNKAKELFRKLERSDRNMHLEDSQKLSDFNANLKKALDNKEE